MMTTTVRLLFTSTIHFDALTGRKIPFRLGEASLHRGSQGQPGHQVSHKVNRVTKSTQQGRRQLPEGDTLRRLADSLDQRFAGKTIRSSIFRHPRLATVDLSGCRLDNADAVGKHLLVRFSNNATLHVHLRLSGAVYQRRAAEVSVQQRRFEIELEDGWITGINTPVVEMLRTRDEHRVVSHLGPDVCGSYDHDAACNKYEQLTDVPTTQALLDQTIVAGFGNIYAVETPFIVGVPPAMPIDQLSDRRGLLTIAAGLIRANARLGPQNTTGRNLKRTEHWVLSRQIYQCRVCGSKISRLRQTETPWQRRTAWCPECQPPDGKIVNLARAAKLLALHPCRKLIDIKSGTFRVDTSQPVETLFLNRNEGGRKKMK